MKIVIFVFLVFNCLISIAQTGWANWHKLYSDNNISVEIQFYYSVNSCVDGGKAFKFQYRLNGFISKNVQFINWKMNYLNCNGESFYEQNSIEIGGPDALKTYGVYKLVDNVIYDHFNNKFICSSLIDPFYDVEISATKVTGSAPNIITMSKEPIAIDGSKTLLLGQSTLLTVNGGILGFGANWVWYKDHCGSIKIGQGKTLSVQPTEQTTYFVRGEGKNNITPCVQFKIVVDRRSADALVKAGKLMMESKFEDALKAYYEVLIIDSKNNVALNRIKEINEILEIIRKRATTIYSYSEVNLKGYNELTLKISDLLNTSASDSKEGTIRFKYAIQFDKEGKNLSNFNIYKSTVPSIRNILEQLPSLIGFTAPKNKGFFLISKQELDINLTWKTQSLTYRSNYKGIRTGKKTSVPEAVFEDYIRRSNIPNGKFRFQVKEKTFNNIVYTDIQLVNYRTMAGPLSCFYSMLLPGLGTLRVTNGEKGRGRFAIFAISAGVSASSKFYSNTKYKQYLGATNQIDMDDYYKKANFSNRLFIVIGGLAASIYVYDVLWVFSKGIQNFKKASNFKSQLKKAPYTIQIQPIIVQ